MHDLSAKGTPQIDNKAKITALPPASFASVYKIEWEHGSNASLAALERGGTIVNNSFASAHHLHIGQRLDGADARGQAGSAHDRGHRQGQSAACSPN